MPLLWVLHPYSLPYHYSYIYSIFCFFILHFYAILHVFLFGFVRALRQKLAGMSIGYTPKAPGNNVEITG